MRTLFCTPQDLSNLAADDITDEQYLNRETSGNEVFIIDTEKGFMQERDDDYRDSCEIIYDPPFAISWVFSEVGESHEQETLLITQGCFFTYFQHFGIVKIASIVTAYSGCCTKA